MNEIIVCPVCGFSFRVSISKDIKDKVRCPMCGYEFKKYNIFPFNSEEFD
ncbi:MAG: hypothetical protein ACFFEY_15270 [Candidatus Thorarchaeota archaeon]